MARSHAKLLSSIWADPDWLKLSESAQRAYMLALSCVEHAVAHIEAMPDCPHVDRDGVPDTDTAQTPAWQLGAALGHLGAALESLTEYEQRGGV